MPCIKQVHNKNVIFWARHCSAGHKVDYWLAVDPYLKPETSMNPPFLLYSYYYFPSFIIFSYIPHCDINEFEIIGATYIPHRDNI